MEKIGKRWCQHVCRRVTNEDIRMVTVIIMQGNRKRASSKTRSVDTVKGAMYSCELRGTCFLNKSPKRELVNCLQG
jgi:hypothetical protein